VSSKGPTEDGTITQTTNNPTSTAQLGYLEGQPGNGISGWNGAAWLTGNDPLTYYPGQTLATPAPSLLQGLGYEGGYGLNPLENSSGGVNTSLLDSFDAGNSNSLGTLNGLLTGSAGIGNSPAFGGLSSLGSGSNPLLSPLEASASGAYLNSNPYEAGEFAAAAQPVINAYQTATAPQTDSTAEANGRYGSGWEQNAQSQNQLNLGTTLGNLASNLYGSNYQSELANMTGAQEALPGVANSALSTLQSGYNTGNQQLLETLGLAPSTLQIPLNDANAAISAGSGLTGLSQNQINAAMNQYYGTEEAPWEAEEQYMNLIGQPTLGSSSVTSPLLGPNTMSSVLGTGLGLTSLGTGLFGKGAGTGLLSGLFGSGGGGDYGSAV
jgi:hypothetical protein